MSARAPFPAPRVESHTPRRRCGCSSLRVLVIDGHPRSDSLGSSIAETIHRGAASRYEECRFVRLRELHFDPCAQGRALDADLRQAQRSIAWAELVVFVYPTWWGGVPALLKGFLDRVFHPGFAFTERSDGGWKGLLHGRAALLVTTMDTPRWIYRWLLGAPGNRAMREATLGFCGIAPVRILSFGPVRTSTLAERRRWLARVAREGRCLEQTFRTGWRAKLCAWLAVSRLHFYVEPWLAYTLGALAMIADSRNEWHWPAYLLGYSGIFLIEFITVVTNELADLASDRANENASALTGGSRVLVNRRLTSEELRRGRRIASTLLAAVLLAGLFVVPHAWPMIAVAAIGVALGVAYSAPPVRLCARGLGEINVAVTHSFLVVLAGYASQAGPLSALTPWLLAVPLAFAVLPSITLAGFPDFEADAATGKRTLVVRFGRHRAAILAAACALCAALLPLCIPGPDRAWLWWTALPAIPHAIWLAIRLCGYVKQGCPPGRIDTLLIIALTFMIWFCIVPLVVLLRNAVA